MQKHLTPSSHQPPRWEAELVASRVVEVTAAQFGFDPAEATLDWRLGEEIRGDSIDIVEWIMEIEEACDVEITAASSQQWFTSQPLSLRLIVEMVLALRQRSRAERARREVEPLVSYAAECLPCTQLGGELPANRWQMGRLYDPLDMTAQGRPQFLRRTDGMRCVLVPAGVATIGGAGGESLPDQLPRHPVTVRAFLIDAEPVSVKAFARFLSSVRPVPTKVLREWCLVDPTDRRQPFLPLRKSWWGRWLPLPGTAWQPMVLVSWFGASAYSLWANRRDWRRYRGDGAVPAELRNSRVRAAELDGLDTLLPSEVQWEYAARGGDGRPYPWGDGAPTAERARVGCHAPGTTWTPMTLPAAAVSARLGMSPFGLHHMAGNVWQWCRDWYAADFYGRPEAVLTDAENRQPSGIRSERGGSWVGPPSLVQSAYRRGRPPEAVGRCLGFRCIGLPEDLD